MSADAPAQRRTSPFPGLSPFTADDRAFYFGRSVACNDVVDLAIAYRVAVLFGASGVGKSSLLRAAVVPQLEAGGRTPIVCSEWAEGAVAGLRGALAQLLGPASCTSDDASLADLVAAASRRATGRLVLILDQFEELFAGGEGADADALGDAIDGAGPDVTFLIAIREDALGDLTHLQDVVPDLLDNMLRLEHLDAAEAREAIVCPVHAWNEAMDDHVVVTPALVDALLAQLPRLDGTTGVPAPYLQLVLARLWEAMPADRVLDAPLLAEPDGAERIIAEHVDRAMSALSARKQRAAAAMLDRLVTPSGAKVPYGVDDLAERTQLTDAEAEAILRRLSTARLLVRVGGDRYQLYHDALARPLREWRTRWSDRARRRRERRRLFAIMAFVAVLLVLARLADSFEEIELVTVDARFELRGERTAPRDIVIVAIDDASLARLRHDARLPRAMAGDAIDWIAEGRPRAIAYDIDFTGRAPGNRSLAEAINGAGVVVLATDVVEPGGRVRILNDGSILELIGARAGYSGFRPDLGGAIRRPVYEVDGLRSFAVETAELALARPVARDGWDAAWLDLYGPEGTFQAIPFWKVVEHRVPRRFFRNKIVVVGVTSPTADDRNPVWGLGTADMSGPELQATAIDTVRRDLPLRSPPLPVTLLTIAIGALLPPLLRLGARRTMRTTFLLTAVAASAYAGLAALLFARGWVLELATPLMGLLLAGLVTTLVGVVAPEPRPRRKAS